MSGLPAEKAPLLLFVCSGNICRSPMAAAMAAQAAARSSLPIRVASSGTMALIGDPAEDAAQRAVAELGLTLDTHRARQTTAESIEEAALVVAMTRSHKAWLCIHAPRAEKKIVSFDELTGLGDVPDPYGGTLQEYQAVRDVLAGGMPRVLDAFKATLPAKAKTRPAQ